MKVLFLTSSNISIPLQNWLRDSANEDVVVVQQRLTHDTIAAVRPDFTVSYNYRFILPDETIGLLNRRVINLHISLLPWNRGASPNVWSFLNDTPSGVTIHELDAGLDTGSILVQRELVFTAPDETLESSYQQLHQAIQELFQQNWHRIRNQSIAPCPQSGPGTFQSLADYRRIASILEPEGWKIPIAVLKSRYELFLTAL